MGLTERLVINLGVEIVHEANRKYICNSVHPQIFNKKSLKYAQLHKQSSLLAIQLIGIIAQVFQFVENYFFFIHLPGVLLRIVFLITS